MSPDADLLKISLSACLLKNMKMLWFVFELTLKHCLWLSLSKGGLPCFSCFFFKVDEPSYGFWADNKGLTGIRLHCISLSNVLKGSFEDYTSVQSEVGR